MAQDHRAISQVRRTTGGPSLGLSSDPTTGRPKISPTRLHHGAEHLFGREKDLAALDDAWKDSATHVLTIVAWGGVGKTSLVIEWMARRAAAGWPGFERVFDWSFYSQGTREQGAASADNFIAAALKFFGDEEMAGSAASPWDKGARLAQLVAERRTLLVLDGLEPLQHPPGPMNGQLKDPAIEVLLKGLAQQNPGLCLVNTRVQVADLAPFRNTIAPQWDLEHLSEEAGAAVLYLGGVNRAGAGQIAAGDPELKTASIEVNGHALTLNLLGRYLAKAHHGDIRKRDQVKFEKADAKTQGGHAFKTMAAYEKWLVEAGDDGVRALAALRLLGLFDRPADAGCLAALRHEPVIAGLTDPLVGLGEEDWNLTLSLLADCGLVSFQSETPDPQSEIDAHPLIREYFANQLREGKPEAWRAAHRRLYEHLKDSPEDKPKPTLEDLQPLYQAVAHGCQAGMYREACNEVYADRILRGDEVYSTKKLGAIGADLGAIACFFEQPWGQISPELSEAERAWLLNEAGFRLRALGRLTEALKPMRSGLDMVVGQDDWVNASIGASNLSSLLSTLGDLTGALRDAEQSVTFANRSTDAFHQLSKRARLADALHQAGRRDEAGALFHEAETMQVVYEPQFPLLYSTQGFLFCDLLLAELERAAWQRLKCAAPVSTREHNAPAFSIARCSEVEQRARQTLELATAEDILLAIGLDHLTLGRAALFWAVLTDSKTDHAEALEAAREQLNTAVDDLRRAGQEHEIPRGLLSRAWLRFVEGDADGARLDLDEAWQIAERGPMRLFMADIHLYRARLFHAEKPYPWTSPVEDLAQARKLIEHCGYHRRDEELADAEQAAKSW
ncbi:MAG: ATP-binding protein [Planctomycetes bacterium]|nr:ATP-binding protein [Planctomycetota bacterium]